ncbi:MAG TPA: hypothetical protein VFO14_04185 [Vicinamibacterales bacterium]|jgi:hypothetical protein|nr:hypothetical protein [Vicinamibacterales bacterium]
MDALRVRPRFRLGPVVEWLVAALFLFATFAVGSLIFRELRPAAAPATPLRALSQPIRSLVASTPPGVPARAVSVPVLPFIDNKEVRVGDTMAAVAEKLGRAAEVGEQQVDRGSFGERLTRFYDYAGSKFILVFEPAEQNGAFRVSGIYLP